MTIMPFFSFDNINITAVSAAVPSEIVEVDSFKPQFGDELVERFKTLTGIQQFRRTAPHQTASDLGFVAAEEIIKRKNIGGFGDSADTIVLITSDQRYWTWRERTMAYLDAGIFTMNLLYAFHYHQICACPLNALMSIKKRKALRAVVNYSKTEIPMIFISIGRAPEQFMVPGSQRVKINQICQFV